MYEGLGCTPSSDLGQTIEGMLSGEGPNIEGHELWELLEQEHPAEFKELCDAAAEIPVENYLTPNDTDASKQAWRAASKAFYAAERISFALRRKYPELVERAKTIERQIAKEAEQN